MPSKNSVSGSGTLACAVPAKEATGIKNNRKTMMILRIIFTLQNWIKTETASAIP